MKESKVAGSAQAFFAPSRDRFARQTPAEFLRQSWETPNTSGSAAHLGRTELLDNIPDNLVRMAAKATPDCRLVFADEEFLARLSTPSVCRGRRNGSAGSATASPSTSSPRKPMVAPPTVSSGPTATAVSGCWAIRAQCGRSTRAVLECLYPKLSPGGRLLPNDLGHGEYWGARAEIDAYRARHGITNPIATFGHTAWWQK